MQGKASLSSTTVAAKQQQEGVGIAQPPVEGDPQSVGDRALSPRQGEVVEQVAREDVMEAPGLNTYLLFIHLSGLGLLKDSRSYIGNSLVLSAITVKYFHEILQADDSFLW